MIGKLRGTLVEKQPPDLLVDVNGVYYELQVPMTSIYRLPELNHEVSLHTHFAVSESAQQLFGFADKRDRELFRTLIKVNGVGPKLALAILSGMDAEQIVRCVRDDDSTALVKLPGVGKKTAERLVIELRDRLAAWQGEPLSAAPARSGGEVSPAAPEDPEKAVMAEAENALIALGYKPAQATQVVLATQQEHQLERSEDLIRLALRSLAAS